MEPFYRLTKNVSPKTFGVLVVLLALLAVIPLGLSLNQSNQSTQSQAAPESVKVAGTSLTLIQHTFDCRSGDPTNGIHSEQNCNQIKPLGIFAVDLVVHSDLDASNLVKAQLNFDPDKLTVVKIITSNDTQYKAKPTKNETASDFFITYWISNNFKNDTGSIALIGSVPDPGFTTKTDTPAVMARVYLKAKKSGTTTMSFDKSSSIYRNADNQNILNKTVDLKLEIK